MQKLLVLSDGKPGHLNQSRAYAELSGSDYDVAGVAFRNRLCKGLSFLFDRAGLYCSALLTLPTDLGNYSTVVSAGSATYYANRVLARRMAARSVAVMLPRGYRFNGFDLIIGQEHDRPPVRENVLVLPINLCKVQPQSVFVPETDESYIGLVLGGPNKAFAMSPERLRGQIKQIFSKFPNHRIVVATSRRTPTQVEEMLAEFTFDKSWIYSIDPVNPIPDFLGGCDFIFITGDSTSMISEAASFGTSAVEIIPLKETGPATKFNALISGLEKRGCLHLFDGDVGECRVKIDLSSALKESRL